MLRDIVRIAQETRSGGDEITKPLRYYEIYQRYFGNVKDRNMALMELGVYKGESLKVWSKCFPAARIIGVDIEQRQLMFEPESNIAFCQADQTDSRRLGEICRKHAPDGLDIMIDDASHMGQLSKKSYSILFPFVKPGGYYVVEDWGTGYWDHWSDGSAYAPDAVRTVDGDNRLLSHDFGMVGFVKQLVDEVGAAAIRKSIPSAKPLAVEYVHYFPGIVIVKKLRNRVQWVSDAADTRPRGEGAKGLR